MIFRFNFFKVQGGLIDYLPANVIESVSNILSKYLPRTTGWLVFTKSLQMGRASGKSDNKFKEQSRKSQVPSIISRGITVLSCLACGASAIL
jgi:hypothetical protein